MLRTVKLMALVAMFFVALSASAQVTTSALSGVVTDENQQAMIGATITALHTPSGVMPNDVPQPRIRSDDRIWAFIITILVFIIFFVICFFSIRKDNNVKFKITFLCFKMEFSSKRNKH